LPAIMVLVGMVIWIIYLRYLLAKKSIESQTEVNKYRLQLEMASNDRKPLELDYTPDQNGNGSVAALTEKVVVETGKKFNSGESNHDQDRESSP